MFRFFAALLFVSLVHAEDDLDAQVRRFMQVYAAVEQNAADPVAPEPAFYQGAIPGMLRKLDPHSVFFDPDQFEQLKKLQTSTQKGFGTVVSILPGRVIVLQTLPGTPSARAGINAGDEILAVNGYQLGRLEMEQIVALLSQSRQQPAQLVVKRPGNARLLNTTLTPEELQSPSVERTFMLRPGVGYVRVASFDEKTGADIHAAVEKLGGHKLTGLVLDLRNNPGGVLTAALETASLFLPAGTKVVTVRGRAVKERVETVPAAAQPYQFPLAVLINAKSASASEVVTGALQDHDRATVVGETSFGKGLVEGVFPLSESTGLALTTALYYTPSGRSIQKPLDSTQFALAGKTTGTGQQYHTDNGRTVTGGGGITPDAVVEPPVLTRLRAVLDGSGSFTSFATEYLSGHKITSSFEVTADLLDEFKVYLAQRAIQPAVGDWSVERDWIRNRLKTEIFNQALGVEKGDEVEAQRDPVVVRALDLLGPRQRASR